MQPVYYLENPPHGLVIDGPAKGQKIFSEEITYIWCDPAAYPHGPRYKYRKIFSNFANFYQWELI